MRVRHLMIALAAIATMVDDPAIQRAPLMASLLENEVLLIAKTYTKR